MLNLSCFDSFLFNLHFESPVPGVRSLSMSTVACSMSGCHLEGGKVELVGTSPE